MPMHALIVVVMAAIAMISRMRFSLVCGALSP